MKYRRSYDLYASVNFLLNDAQVDIEQYHNN